MVIFKLDHGYYKLSVPDYGQPWSNVKVKILTMVDLGWSSNQVCLTMVKQFQIVTLPDHGQVKHGWSTLKKMTILITIAKNEYHVTVL